MEQKVAYETGMTGLAVTIPPDQIRHAGEPVFPELRKILEYHTRGELLKLVDQREAYGIAKYGQTLMSDDGRDTPTEIVNELLDALVYLTKLSMQHPDHWGVKGVMLKALHLADDMLDLAAELDRQR